MRVFLINEENHSAIGICDSITSGLTFLVNENWLDANVETVLEDGTPLPMWRYLGFTSRKSCEPKDVFIHFNGLPEEKAIEELELFGFYFEDFILIE